MTLKTEVRKNPGLVQNDSTLRAIPSMRTYSGEIYPVVVKDAITGVGICVTIFPPF